MKTKMSLILGSAFLAFNSMASGHDVGNGGNAVVCYTDSTRQSITSVKLFDYWEYDTVHPEFGGLDLGAPTLSVADKVSKFISRVRIFDKPRANAYRVYADILLNDLSSYLVTQIPGPSIDDDTPLALPTAPCYKEQFAVQVKYPAPGSRRFQINATLFNDPSTDNDARAGIILHEVIYRYAIQNEAATKSDGTRLMNNIYSKTAFDQKDSVDLQTLYHQASMKFYDDKIAVTILPFNIKALFDRAITQPGPWPQNYILYSGLRIKSPDSKFDLMDLGEQYNGTVEINWDSTSHEGYLNKINQPYQSATVKMNGVMTSITPVDKEKSSFLIEFYPKSIHPKYIYNYHPANEGSTFSPVPTLNQLAAGVLCEHNRPIELSQNGKVLGCANSNRTLSSYPLGTQTLSLGCINDTETYPGCNLFGASIFGPFYVSFYDSGALHEFSSHSEFTGVSKNTGLPISMASGTASLLEDGTIRSGIAKSIPLTSAFAGIFLEFKGKFEYQENGNYISRDISALDRTEENYGSGFTATVNSSAVSGFIVDANDVYGKQACETLFPQNRNALLGRYLMNSNFLVEITIGGTQVIGTKTYFNASSGTFNTVTDDLVYSTVEPINCLARVGTILNP